jgi:hypothetical protein
MFTIFNLLKWLSYVVLKGYLSNTPLTSCVGWDIRYPSHARMWIAPMQTTVGERKLQEYQHSMGDWSRFIQETSDQYGVDMRVLTDPYREEQRKYFLQARDLEMGFFNLLFFLEIPNNQCMVPLLRISFIGTFILLC